jgi:small subunit ribosomal protein S25e
MGGAKKKSVGNQEKTSKDSSGADEKGKKGEKKGPIKKQKSSIVIEEPQGLKTIKSMKPITSHALARSMGVKISVANSFLRTLESKGIVRPIGGYSGHRIYELGPTEAISQ